jgi:hypothetical protein
MSINPLHLTAGVVCGAESRGHSPAAGERERWADEEE